jgi:hypothetical protein
VRVLTVVNPLFFIYAASISDFLRATVRAALFLTYTQMLRCATACNLLLFDFMTLCTHALCCLVRVCRPTVAALRTLHG